MKRIVCIWLALLLTAGSLWSCGDTEEPETTEAPETSETELAADTAEQGPETEEPAYAPAGEDFDGASFTILHPTERSYDIAEESNGELVNDAIFDRDMMIAELYNIHFVHEQETDEYSSRHIYNNKIRGVVMANDPVYDLVYGIEICTTETFTEGLYHNLMNFDEMLLDEVWWCPGQTETFGIHGKLFGAIGLSTLDLYKEASVIFYNDKLLTDFGLESPDQAVINGTWTLDSFMAMTTAATQDIDGDGKATLGTDIIGFISRETNNRSWQTGLGIEILVPTEDGTSMTAETSDRTAAIIDTMRNFVTGNSASVSVLSGKDSELAAAFMADTALFLCERLKKSEIMRDMESDYGVLPFPKYDVQQEEYYAQVATATTFILFPLSISNPHMSAMISEAMSFYGNEQIVPKYYESALKSKYMRDEESSKVLDVIFSCPVNSISFAYAGTLGGTVNLNQIFQQCAFGTKEYASTIAANKKVWEKTLTKLYDAFEALGD